ncbi:MAG: HAMP domain-containing sensor histidine kinase [bacterium]
MFSNFTKTIKFKLAIIFSVVLFLSIGTTIFMFNVAITNYLSTRSPRQEDVAPQVAQGQLPPQQQESEELREVRAVHSNNLESVQSRSIISLVPIAFLSFILGYFLAGRFLRPLNKLNEQIDTLKFDTLGAQIEHIPENEMGKTMQSFNEMSERLQVAFEQQARFVQDASHELRTPLTIVRTNLETVLDDPRASKKEYKESMREVLEELDSVTTLANDLLTLSKPQSVQRTKQDLVVFVQECFIVLQELASRQKVQLRLQCSDKEHLTILANGSELGRAFRNIMENAIKYSQSGKRQDILVLVARKGKKAVVEVQDSGVGIPKADVGKIFERFYRVDKSRDRNTGGFGLGLAITKKIVQEHGGKISVRSKPGETVFTVVLPLTDSKKL